MDVFALEEVVEHVFLRTAEQAQGAATEHRDGRDVQPLPHHEHEDGLGDLDAAALGESGRFEASIEVERGPGTGEEVVDVVGSIVEDV